MTCAHTVTVGGSSVHAARVVEMGSFSTEYLTKRSHPDFKLALPPTQP